MTNLQKMIITQHAFIITPIKHAFIITTSDFEIWLRTYNRNDRHAFVETVNASLMHANRSWAPLHAAAVETLVTLRCSVVRIWTMSGSSLLRLRDMAHMRTNSHTRCSNKVHV